jgi:tripartite-type tricarboxylate transporter receptor subunit TctC
VTRCMMWCVVWLGLLSGPAAAQTDYPARPVRIVVPTAPGGAADTLARTLAQHLSQAGGQQFFIENRPGAANVLGIETVAKAPGDGYTLLMVASTITINHVVHKSLPYDVERDFAPITQLVSLPNVLVVHPSLPVTSVAELVAAAKRQPGKLSYASAGVGSQLQLAMELLKSAAGVDIVHVPYKGAAPALNDVLAGHVSSMVSNVLSAKPHIDAGTLRPLAVTSLKRVDAMPQVPTMTEAGFAGYEVVNWFGLFAPAGTPKPIVERLHAEAVRVLATAEMKQRLGTEGAEPVGSTPAAFAAFIKDEMTRWSAAARTANIRPE